MFLDLMDSRGGGPLVNVFLRALSTKFTFQFSPLKIVCSMFLDFMDSRGEGEPLVNVFLRAFLTKFAF